MEIHVHMNCRQMLVAVLFTIIRLNTHTAAAGDVRLSVAHPCNEILLSKENEGMRNTCNCVTSLRQTLTPSVNKPGAKERIPSSDST